MLRNTLIMPSLVVGLLLLSWELFDEAPNASAACTAPCKSGCFVWKGWCGVRRAQIHAQYAQGVVSSGNTNNLCTNGTPGGRPALKLVGDFRFIPSAKCNLTCTRSISKHQTLFSRFLFGVLCLFESVIHLYTLILSEWIWSVNGFRQKIYPFGKISFWLYTVVKE